MDLSSLIEIIIAIVVVYFFIKFIALPFVRVILGIILFLILISLLQRFGFNFDNILAPFGIKLNTSKWGVNLNWILNPINYYIDKIASFLTFIWGNFVKNK